MVGFSGLYYKHITIVNEDSSVVSKCQVLLIEDTKVVIQAAGLTHEH
jgi:hypothetical protein